MPRKNARQTAFPNCVSSYTVTDGDYRADIDAKDFPANGTFRVYRVRGDITRPERLKAAIGNLLEEYGVQHRNVEIAL